MDERLTGMCVYCGAQPDTRDHVPSKVLLDEPYPPQLPVVGACECCNVSFSLDEQYLACLIECIICGSTNSANIQRPNVKRILDGNPALQQRIEGSRRQAETGNLLWEPEADRIRNVILKLARGHVAYELYPRLEEPVEVTFAPIRALKVEERAAFERLTPEKLDLWPEFGSRSFLRAFGKSPDRFKQSGDWIVVQQARYRYAVAEAGGLLTRMVLSEYLACEVVWEV